MAETNRVVLKYVAEATWNTTPTSATKSLQTVRYTSDSFNPEVSNIVSSEIRSDRSVSDLVQVSRQNTGSLEFELSRGTYDTWMEGALFSTWATNVLRNGTTRKMYTIEKNFADVTRYIRYTGMVVNQWSLNLRSAQMVTGSFAFMGGSATQYATALTGTTVAATTATVLNCGSNVAYIKEGSTLTNMTGIYVQDLSFTVNNNLRFIQGIGSAVPQDIAAGKCDITGSLSAILNASTQTRLMASFLSGAASKIEVQISGSGKSYTILFPKVKWETESIPTGGQDQDVIENLTFRALYDASENCMMKITRVP